MGLCNIKQVESLYVRQLSWLQPPSSPVRFQNSTPTEAGISTHLEKNNPSFQIQKETSVNT